MKPNLSAVLHRYWHSILMLAVLTLAGHALGQSSIQIIREFGFTNRLASGPYGGVIQGTDGALFGTTYSGGISNAGTVFRMSTDGSGFTILHRFGASADDGSKPRASLIQARDGALYGTTSSGGTNNAGTVFRLRADGSDYMVLHHFPLNGSDGNNPRAGLIQGQDGDLYGAAYSGGTHQAGTIFKLSTDGSSFAVLHTFADGISPAGSLLQMPDGVLYGTTYYGGISNAGVVFKLGTNGAGYAVLHTFKGTNGANPAAGLIQGRDGALYGTTYAGGSGGYNNGTVFKLNTSGTAFTLLHSFSGGPDSVRPCAPLLQASDGRLYGTTYGDGMPSQGTLFSISTNGSAGSSYTFGSAAGDGYNPCAGLIQGTDGALYGTTSSGSGILRGTVFRFYPAGAGCSVVYRFTSSGGDGAEPHSALARGVDGFLYGTCVSGGFNNLGTVFKLSRDGSSYNVIHEFTATNGDGATPHGGIVQADDGILYGTTLYGGTAGWGTVFRLATNGSLFEVLHSFTGVGGDGRQPYSALLPALDGLLYGTTYNGGASNLGTIFKLNRNGSGYIILHHFGGRISSDGENPHGSLIQGHDGALYGTTESGGTNYSGTLFKLNADGSNYVVLRHFGSADRSGSSPHAGVLQCGDGLLYGTTYSGGTYGGGTAFRVDTNGLNHAVICNFRSNLRDGLYPYAGLVQGRDHVLYGTTYIGGTNDGGTVFKLSTTGSNYLVLHRFAGPPRDAARPGGALIEDTDGTFCGTTSGGGGLYVGTVFRVLPVAQILRSPHLLPDGSFQLVSSYADGWPVTPEDLDRFQAQAATNFADWVTLTGGLSVSNGTLLLIDSAGPFSRRFYRVIENRSVPAGGNPFTSAPPPIHP